MRNFLLIIIVLISSVTYSQECDTLFNFNEWSMKGHPDGEWVLLDSNNVLNTSYILPPTMFVNKNNMINIVMEGTISVETAQDADFIGLVFGYKKPTGIDIDNFYNFYLFDWKAETADVLGNRAYEGFRISRYSGNIIENEVADYFWGTKEDAKRSIINHKYGSGLGWKPFEKYHFKLVYTESTIIISINDELIFEQIGCFQKGRLGFYCMSQTKVHFENFSIKTFIDFIPQPKSACAGESIEFFPYNPDCSQLPDFVDSLLWNFGDDVISKEILPQHNYVNPGNYTIQLIAYKENNCIDTIYKTVEIKPFPKVNLGNDTIVDVCTSLSFDAYYPDATYLWSNSSNSSQIQLDSLSTDTTIWVNVNLNSCLVSDTVNIAVNNPSVELFMPNAFSPNGDGLNDVFLPVGEIGLPDSYNFQIYNRWGQLIFETESINEGWNGKMGNGDCPQGVYVYKLNYRTSSVCLEGKTYSEKGTILLLE